MQIIITESFAQREMRPLKKYYTIHNIIKTVRKMQCSPIRLSHFGYSDGELLKLRMAHKVAGRLIVYVFRQGTLVVPILMRLKKDKLIGENLAVKNKKAKHLIISALDQTMIDIKTKKYKRLD